MTAKKQTSDERAKERAKAHKHAETRYNEGLRDGQHDVKSHKPLRKVAKGARDPYAKGYRKGVALERERMKIAGK